MAEPVRPASEPVPSIDDLRSRIASLKQAAPTTQDIIDRKLANDRSWVTRWVVGTFLLVMIAVIAKSLFYGYDASLASVVDLIKTVLIPVVTLILGHYFGQSGKSGK